VCCNAIALDQVGSFVRNIRAFVDFRLFESELPSSFVKVLCCLVVLSFCECVVLLYAAVLHVYACVVCAPVSDVLYAVL
jgi:hypothetical protein